MVLPTHGDCLPVVVVLRLLDDFPNRAKPVSAELELRLNRHWLLLAGAGLAGFAIGALGSRRGAAGVPSVVSAVVPASEGRTL